ncbi:GNAT family N-acetyltransferase [Rhodopila globiformis]|uniref:GNAT family N-acetyltransferase n=1 Tax=Rhodopila globiformis TaxID=1071 RepID=UPI0013050663|nr:GNAT family N-acetyltransferase [Rhodopila globiformis]
MTDIRVSVVTDFAALGERWRALERRADASFFQTWSWYGCLAAERFAEPVLVEATEAGRCVALALFNRVRDRFGPPRLHLWESGRAALDCPYIEQNGVLAEAGRADELTAACLRAVAADHVLVLPGVGAATLAAARCVARLVEVSSWHDSPFVDLARLRAAGGDYLAARSANTRQQIRRSDRFHTQDGAIVVERAETVHAALAMLDEMADLHQATWSARGQPGCFAAPFFRRFHTALITTALPRGEVALLRVRGGVGTVGILYGFAFRGRMYAYQSGFAYRRGEARARPGLTSHHAAIRYALAAGFDRYDFLAGDDRYKRSLSDQAHPQYWVEAGPAWAPRLLLSKVLDSFR